MNKTRSLILGIVLVLSYVTIYAADALNCTAPGVSLYSNVTAVSNGQQLVSGVAVWCLNGDFVSLCDEDDSFGNDDANLVCTSKGFNGGIVLLSPNASLYATLPQPSMYYSNFTCPPNPVNTDSCTVMLSTDPFCINGSKDIFIQCSRPAPTSTITASSTVTSTTSSPIMTTTSTPGSTSSSTTNSNTPSSTPDGSSNIDIRFIASVATGGAVLLLIIIVIIVFIIIGVCIYKRGPKKPKPSKPVEMSGFHN